MPRSTTADPIRDLASTLGVLAEGEPMPARFWVGRDERGVPCITFFAPERIEDLASVHESAEAAATAFLALDAHHHGSHP